MAGNWIKMRAALMQSPRLIAMSHHLHDIREFREWLTPGEGSDQNGQIVSDSALRCVTCALLMRVWSVSREYGKFDSNDCLLSGIFITDIDGMADCPGVGEAMRLVGWAYSMVGDDGSPDGVVLPNFIQHNVPMTSAERQKAYRNKGKIDDGSSSITVTKPLRGTVTKPVTRVEKRREDKEPPISPPSKTSTAAKKLLGAGPVPDSYSPEFETHWVNWNPSYRGGRNKVSAFKAWWKAVGKVTSSQRDR